MRRASFLTALPLLLAAPLLPLVATSCDPPPTPSVTVEVGPSFVVTIQDGNRLVISSADGRVLLDGLAPGDIENDAPFTGLAGRDQTTTYEMRFGAFKPTVTPAGEWTVATSFRLDPSGDLIDALDARTNTLARISFSSPEEGHLVMHLDSAYAHHVSLGFLCAENDHFAGFGAQTWDVDHRGQTVPTFVTEEGIGKSEDDSYTGLWEVQGQRHSSQAPLPQYLSSRGYMLTAKTDTRAIFALCSERTNVARIEVDAPTDIHIFDGPAPADAIKRASATFGRPRTPPLVAFAPWNDAIFGSANVRRIAQKLRDNGIPSSVIWTEDWRGGDMDGDNYSLKEEWDVDSTLYPDFEALATDLHALGYDFHVYFNPFVYEGSKAWAETQPKGFLIKRTDGSDYTFDGAKFTKTGLVDLTNPDARAWAIGKMRAAMQLGADGWMNDFGEWLPTDGVGASGDTLIEHNRYPVAWQKVARDAIDGMGDGKERLFFARSGWFGTPELADVFWAGDQRTTFDRDDGMPTILPIGIGLGLVGISTYGHDIGGYQSANNDPSTKEVFFRWTELGAWSPVMRTHHGTKPNLEWSWEKDDETLQHFKRYAKLHMALVPTMSGLAKVATATGLPIWRALSIAYPADEKVWGIDDEVMLGDGLVIAPVTDAGATARDVYLPEGTWYAWGGGVTVQGGATFSTPAPVGEIPVFARAGTIVPMFPDGVMTLTNGSAMVPDASTVKDDRVVEAFLGADGSFDEGNGLTYAIASTEIAPGTALTFAFTPSGGAESPLQACATPAVAPCVVKTGAGTAELLVSGPGSVRASPGDAKITIAGGAADRSLTLRVHTP
ncbi:MAG: glycoside hydrolase family 31 protein [Polyangiaceae bacterium]